MKNVNLKIIASTLSVLILCCVAFFAVSFSQDQMYDGYDQTQQGRFAVVIMSGRPTSTGRIPAIILDSYQGIVWNCRNIGEDTPKWFKTDLAQNGDKVLTQKRYIIKMFNSLYTNYTNLKVPVIVLDIQDGITWTCRDVSDENPSWAKKDLTKDTTDDKPKIYY